MPAAAIPAVIGLAASLAGTGLGIAGAEQSRSSMNDALQSQLNRQKKFAQQGSQDLTSAIGQQGAMPAQKSQAVGAAQALAQQQQLQGLPSNVSLGTTPSTGLGGQIVNKAGQAETGVQNQSNAQLQGYQSMLQNAGLSQLGLQTQLGQLGTFANNQLSTLPFALSQAQQSGQGLGAIGSLLGAAGNVAGTYGGINNGFGALFGGGGLPQGWSSPALPVYGPTSNNWASPGF